LGLIPARGGSKSIPKKNIAPLHGRPLISYVIRAAQRSRSIDRTICSTDDNEIAGICQDFDVEVMERKPELAQDTTHVIEVIKDVIRTLEKSQDYVPDAVALLQPTSPFLLPDHIDGCVDLLKNNPRAGSSQTVAEFPHNFHAYNQRVIEDNVVRFRFQEERAVCYNKQSKPKFFVFGNLIVTRTEALFEQEEIFASPSYPYEIPYHYALDVDGPEDLEMAEWYLERAKVLLPSDNAEETGR
jgi:CMP-N-acetylneuraminic acid synthetase